MAAVVVGFIVVFFLFLKLSDAVATGLIKILVRCIGTPR